MRIRPAGLWQHPNFLRLWAGQTVSVFGSQVTALALPLTAVLSFNATPGQMGLLRAVQSIPFLVVGLFVGVWVDRVRRRPLLIGVDLGRALLLGLIPAAAGVGLLRIEHLYVVGFAVGVLTTVFTVAYRAFLPAVVPREALVEGNSKLTVSDQVAQVGGPGAAGALIQVLTAPVAIAVDAASFGVSALLLALNTTPEPAPQPRSPRSGVWMEIGQGLRFTWADRVVRAVTLATSTVNLWFGMLAAVLVLYATDDLGVRPAALGVTYAIGGGGGLLGALLATRVADRFGAGPTLIGTAVLYGGGVLVAPLAGLNVGPAILLLAVYQGIAAFASVIYSINGVSLMQARTPAELQGRMTASTRVIIAGAASAGALAGGVLGDAIDLQATLWVAAGGVLLGVPWLWFSPVRGLRDLPKPLEVVA